MGSWIDRPGMETPAIVRKLRNFGNITPPVMAHEGTCTRIWQPEGRARAGAKPGPGRRLPGGAGYHGTHPHLATGAQVRDLLRIAPDPPAAKSWYMSPRGP